MLKTDVIWPDHRQFKSKTQWEPVGFFSECLCNSSQFDLLLGFFSSSAIQVLSDGFALFLYNGGRMRLIINDVLTQEDINFIKNGQTPNLLEFFDLKNLQEIKDTLSVRDRHFFNCLSFLIQNNRLEIKIIRPLDSYGISHTKMGVFSDGVNSISFDGSCNFSQTALIQNIESVTASCDWDGKIEKAKVEHAKELFNLTFDGKDQSVEYLDIASLKENIKNAFKTTDVISLLEEEKEILNNTKKKSFIIPNNINYALKRAKERINTTINRLKEDLPSYGSSDKKNIPSFPYPSGPREYQKLAYENWKNNHQKGLFAMATGTGKTITALNCLLNIYIKTKTYKAIILVPTTVLVDQWEKECKKFQFDNIIKLYSKNQNWKSELDNIILQEKIDENNSSSYIIISTYASFARDNVFNTLVQFPRKKVLLISDEAHNMGAGKIKVRLEAIPYLRRIGLSATPNRQYDDDGNNAINNFFGTNNGYTFEYSMKRAIDDKCLCEYYYYPHIVYLNSDELEEYSELSNKIVKFYNLENQSFTENEILTALLLKRKRIIHKAENKKTIFRKILEERIQEKGSLKYTLVYVPEGNDVTDFTNTDFDKSDTIGNDTESSHLIDEYTQIVAETDPHTTVKEFTSDTPNRDEILSQFASGKLDVLTSMKCLDEGVDVPRSELAIFCASTGNPRQFIQRRGRILRLHPEKQYAVIHDLIVAPKISNNTPTYKMERNLLNNEMKRVREFANLALNNSDTVKELEDILTFYKLPTF